MRKKIIINIVIGKPAKSLNYPNISGYYYERWYLDYEEYEEYVFNSHITEDVEWTSKITPFEYKKEYDGYTIH